MMSDILLAWLLAEASKCNSHTSNIVNGKVDDSMRIRSTRDNYFSIIKSTNSNKGDNYDKEIN